MIAWSTNLYELEYKLTNKSKKKVKLQVAERIMLYFQE